MIVVTGAAGLIGSAIIWALNQRSEENILAVDWLKTDERWKNLRGVRFAGYFDRDDFLRRLEENRLPSGITAIIHMGACSDTTERDAGFLMENNFQYTCRLAQIATAAGIRFIYASSAATYGDGSAGYSDSHDRLPRLLPLNMYGYSKHVFDLWAWRNGLLDKIAGLKYFNVFGPNEYHKGGMRSVVLKAFEQIRADGVIRLFKSYRPEYGDGEQQRDFLYVKDAAAMTLFFLDHPETGGIYNIGSGVARSWNDLARAIFQSLGRPVSITYIDMPEELRDRYQYFTKADQGKLRHAGCDLTPAGLEDAVADYVREYLLPGKHLSSLPAV